MMQTNCKIVVLLIILPIPVFANSSWNWFTDEPYTILPFVIIFTLLFEIILLLFFNKIRRVWKIIIVSLVIIIANLLSFLGPFIYWGIADEPVPEELKSRFFEKITYSIHHWPQYIIGIGFMILTLVIEVPIVYILLQNYVKNKKRLIFTIFAVNIISTIIIAIIERIKFKGEW